MSLQKGVANFFVFLVALGTSISMAVTDSQCGSDERIAELYSCSEAADLSAVSQCRKREYEDAKAKMQKPLSELLETYAREEPALVDRFTNAQRAWENYIKKDCEYEIYYSLGTQAEAAQRFHCLEGHYRARIRHLNEKVRTP